MANDRVVVKIDATLAELIPPFLDNRRKDVARLEELLTAGDTAGVKKLGHNLKGCGGGYGFEKISDLGARIEACGADGDLSALPALRAELADFLERVEVKFE